MLLSTATEISNCNRVQISRVWAPATSTTAAIWRLRLQLLSVTIFWYFVGDIRTFGYLLHRTVIQLRKIEQIGCGVCWQTASRNHVLQPYRGVVGVVRAHEQEIWFRLQLEIVVPVADGDCVSGWRLWLRLEIAGEYMGLFRHQIYCRTV